MKSEGNPKQRNISAYFSTSPSHNASAKRSASFVDLTLSDNDSEESIREQSTKRPKNVHSITSGTGTKRYLPDTRMEESPSAAGSRDGALEGLRFRTISAHDSESVPQLSKTPAEISARKARREAFKRALLAENNIFSRAGSENGAMFGKTSKACHDEGSGDEEKDGSEDSGPSGGTSMSMNFARDKAYRKEKPQVASKLKSRGKVVEDIGPSGETFTPLEKQVKELKERYPETLLMVEVGYKYRFFGDDAKIASKELGIVCFPDRNFLTASIPTHRREIHLKKLISQGYKVGIIGQTETAALKKVSDNRNAPFERQLTHLFTAATFIDDLNSLDNPARDGAGAAPPVVCITETLLGGIGADERVSFGIVAVTPSTGDVVWDEFEDGFMRSDLETRMAHIRPSEMLLPEKKLSNATEKMLTYFTSSFSDVTGKHERIRIERFNGLMKYTKAFECLSEFYAHKKGSASDDFNSGKLLAVVSNLPQSVSIALAHILDYLNSFGLANVLTRTEFFTKFTERHHMLLNSNTLANLEIYCNQTDFSSKGSLMWVLDRTKTAFGARLLRSWVGRPLLDTDALHSRIDAVEEILTTESVRTRECIVRLRDLLKSLPDIAKGLCRIQYGKCSPKELSILLPAFNKVAKAFEPFESQQSVGFKSDMLNDIVFSLPKLRECTQTIIASINLKKAADDKRAELWTDPDKYASISELQFGILAVESEIQDQLKIIRKILKKPAAQWTSMAGEEYLIEIKKNEKREIPLDWHVVSSTKFTRRYHTPEVREKLKERAQLQETLDAESNKAFRSFLAEIGNDYYAPMRSVVNKLAIADCLLSMATIAAQEGYVKPTIDPTGGLNIVDGRHPMVEAMRSDPFVPNTITLGGAHPRNTIITGPNMGGKSSVVRMIALIALMAQVGSYVPASSASMGLLDAILTRMGASDELMRGRSTFMVEMSETSDILHAATAKSLVILDELGRGTSTFDGMAIASAVLEHLVQSTRCKTLFITHYPLVASELQHKYPQELRNVHMGYTEDTRIDGTRNITFLYRVTNGPASGSFGVECARLAGLPESLLEVAKSQGTEMQANVEAKTRSNRTRKCCSLIQRLMMCTIAERQVLLEDLKTQIGTGLTSTTQ
ncbi:DNA mismatch repair protein MSH3 [Rickenella mellea]|uniref:DNA mismatch repair protein MSH3 n=1 Tax=Rickenella mellea TaxID=50990 RepID=A0A4Y7QKH3_9AGAM|nr:DNA mismatch repair protein MSH3 [Rickenella mellea]